MRSIIILLISLIFIAFSCSVLEHQEDIVEGTGRIIYINLEGGFYGILDDEGGAYDPINLPSGFEEDGLRVKFKGKIRDDLGSCHMWGHLIELIYINKL